MRASSLKPLSVSFGLGVAGAVGAAALLPGARLAAIGVLAAVVLAILVPARTAARGRRRAGLEAIGAVLGIGAVSCAAAPSVGALVLTAYMALWVLALVLWTRAVGRAFGQTATTVLALASLALPYIGAIPLSFFRDAVALDLVLHSPLAFLCGTCADFDILRRGTLYQLLPVTQSSAFSYPSALAGLAVPAVVAGVGWAACALRRRTVRRLPAPVAAAVGLLLLFGAPDVANAQIFPEASGAADASGNIGDMVTRVRLGYYAPVLRGFVRVAGPASSGDRLKLVSDLDIERIFVVPTFEVALYWPNGGGVLLQYMEAIWKGEAQGIKNLDFEGAILRPGTFYESKYQYRTIAFTEYVDIPITDWIKLQIVTTQRYFKHEFRIRTVPDNNGVRDSLEGLIPSFGLAADVLIWQMISVYGDVQWLDFTTSIFGGEDEELEYKTREWKVGVRLELVEQAHISVEFFSLETTVREGQFAKYRQELQGGRIQVSILF